MQLSVNIDTSRLLLRLRNGEKRLGYATANGINQTAIEIQKAERARVSGQFHLRKATFVLRQAAIIAPFASVTQGRPYAEISVGQKDRLLLPTFEKGGDRPPFKGKHVAVPITFGPARPSFGAQVTPSLRFTALDLHKEGGALVGLRRTYVVPGVGVFQRTAKGSRLVYKFESEVHLKPRLGFVETARQVAGAVFAEFVQRETSKALAHDAGRSF